MRALSRITASVATLGVAAVVAAGCGQSEQDAEAALCANLATLKSSVQQLSDTSADSSVDEFQSSVDNVKRAWRDVQDSARNLSNDRQDALDGAWKEFGKTIDDVDDADSLADAKGQIAEGATTFQDSKNEIYSGLDCASNGDDSNG